MQEKESIHTFCPHCGKKYKIPGLFIGKEIPCKYCHSSFTIKNYNFKKKYPLIMTIALKYKLINEQKIIDLLKKYEPLHDQEKTLTLEKYLEDHSIFSDECLNLLITAKEHIEAKKRGKLFGTIAIKMKLVTKQDIYDALIIQAKETQKKNKKRYLGEILVEQGKITEKQCGMILSAIEYNTDKKAAQDKEALQKKLAETKADETPEAPGETENITSAKKEAESLQEENPQKAETTNIYAGIPESPTSHRDVTGSKSGFDYTITHDSKTAFLKYSKPDQEAEPPVIEDILELLPKIGVVHGIIEQELIEDYLKNHLDSETPVKIASAREPVQGKDTDIIYHFETSHLKSGSLHSQGKIDFRDRGKIPVVDPGFLLAEQIPGFPASDGKDVYGHIIHADPVDNINLKLGVGAELSEDNLKAYATIKGQPKISFGGKLSVMSELKIDGNVDYKTGHIDFEGDVLISGIIRNGFKVHGDNIKAANVVSAEIVSTGNITISEGIIDSVIKAQGDVKTKFIRNSTVSAYGDVTVDREIIDTTIDNSGTCNVPSGKVISSTISSKKGIQVKDIGTQVSSPCKFSIGVETHRDNEIQSITETIEILKTQQTELLEKKELMIKEGDDLSLKINQLAHVQDRSQIEIRPLQKKLDELKQAHGPGDEITQIEKEINLLEEKSREADEQIGISFDRQDEIEKETSETDTSLESLERDIEDLEHEVDGILKWSEKESGKSILTVTGIMFEGTVIHGVHSIMTIKEKKRGVKIKELQGSEPPHDWKLHVI